MIQLTLPSQLRRSKGSFGSRPCRAARKRILAGQAHTLPRSWQRKWIIQRILATPPWADFVAIRKVYDLAKQLEFETGQPYDVDHVIPVEPSASLWPAHCNQSQGDSQQAEQREVQQVVS